MTSISHDCGDETPEAKARWFATLTMEQRLACFAEFYDLALSLNPDLPWSKPLPEPSDRVQVLDLNQLPGPTDSSLAGRSRTRWCNRFDAGA